MNGIETSQKPKKDKTIRIIFLVCFSILLFFFECYTRKYLQNISTKYFFSEDPKRCEYFFYSDYLENGLKDFIVLFLLNYVNVYSSIFALFSDYISLWVSGNMKIFYREPRPFVKNPFLKPCLPTISYGAPSSTAMSLFLILGVFYQAMTKSKKPNIYKKKIACGLLWVIIVCYICYVRLLQNIIYLNDFLLGLGCGFCLYYLFFYIVDFDFRDYHQIKVLLDNKFFTISITLIIYSITTFIQYTLLSTPENLKNEAIFTLFQKTFEIDDTSILLENDNYIVQGKIFKVIGAYIALIMEYSIIFKNDSLMYERYNIREVNQNGKMMFNNTKKDISLFRLILLCMSLFYLGLNTVVKNIELSSYFKLISSLPCLQYLVNGILIFFVVKTLLRYIGLTNETLFNSKDKGLYIISN